jgi:hypothetical protein
MAKKLKPPAEDAKAVRCLLRKHSCPVPYHEVRTRFLGNIATLVPGASPLRAIESLWGGEMPVFESRAEVDELYSTLLGGLWNALSRHQERAYPFRLIRVRLDPTPENVGRLAEVRRQEADGFLEGLSDGREELDLPDSAGEAMDRIAEIRAMFAGAHDLVGRGDAAGAPAEIRRTFENLAALSEIMARDINAVVQVCTRARRQMLREAMPGPTNLH